MSQRTSSLRWKLTAWYLLVFAGIQLLLLVLVMSVRQELVAESYKASVALAASTMAKNVITADWDLDSDAVREELVPSELEDLCFFMIRDGDGEVVSWTPGLDIDRVELGEDEDVGIGVGPLRPTFQDGIPDPSPGAPAGSQLLLVTVPFKHAKGTFFLHVAVPHASWWHTLAVFRDQFLLGMSIGLFAAWVAAWLISGRAVSPLRRISAAAQDVSIEKLGERIHVDARDQEVRHLEGELNHALSRIEEGYRAHERFMEAVSHELNTPVAVLLTEAQTLKGAPLSAEEAEEFRVSVEEEMRRLQTLVRSLLSLSKADFVQERDEVQLDDVVTSSVTHCEPLARGRGVRLALSPPDTDGARELFGDRWLLETMLENLMRNAIRVSPEGEPVDVRWSDERGTLVVRVQDRGPGIPEDYLERVFEPFVQVPHERRRLGGTGLGLSIARRIAEVHGGSIRAENNPGPGCTFTVRLPLRASAAPVAESA